MVGWQGERGFSEIYHIGSLSLVAMELLLMEEILHHLEWLKSTKDDDDYPIIYRFLTIPDG